MELTQAQHLMWLGQKLHPQAPLYNMVFEFRIWAELDVDLFRKAFATLLQASDNLRTIIREADGEPQQIVLDTLDFQVPFIDFSNEANPDAVYTEWLDKKRAELFRLDERLFDCALVKLNDDATIWFWNQHHIATDVGTCMVLYNTMSYLYEQAISGQPIAVPHLPAYVDYVADEQATRQTDTWQHSADYWTKELERNIEPVQFYAGGAGATSTHTTRVTVPITQDQHKRLRELAYLPGIRSFSKDLTDANLFTALIWAYLYRLTANDVIRLGVTLGNRSTPQQQQMMGMLLEVLSVTGEFDADDNLLTLVKKAAAANLRTIQHLQPGMSSATHNRAYDVLLNFITGRFSDFAGISTDVSWVHSDYGDDSHKLRIQVHDLNDTGHYTVAFDFNTSAFSELERQYAIDHFLKIVDTCLTHPEQPVRSISLLTNEEQQQFVHAFNATEVDYPSSETVVDLFEQQAASTPDAIALQLDEKSLTYAELNNAANTLAKHVIEAGIQPGQTVPIFVDHSFEMVIAVLGVLKAGAAYVPLDTAYPAERIRQLLGNLGEVPLIVTQSKYANVLADYSTLTIEHAELSASRAQGNVNLSKPDGLAYVMFTSGTTGQPKGVMIEHGNLTNYLWWAKKHYAPDTPKTFALYSSFAFDLTVTSLFVPLISGGSSRIYPEQGQRGTVIRDVFGENAVDVVKLTPSHLALVKDLITPQTRIRTLVVGGEDFKTDLARQIDQASGGAITQYNEYGPTEATVACMLHKFDVAHDVRASVPIGAPADNMRVHVLDKHLQPVPTGLIGEMYLAGDNLARGYYQQPELTADRFITDRNGQRLYRTGDRARWLPSGQLEFLGRNDGQVKVGGARIELNEVEAALLSHPSVTEAAVMVRDIEQQAASEAEITYCVRCGIASNYPGITFDAHGECSICTQYDAYKDKAAQYFSNMEVLTDLVEQVKGESTGEYDCLVLLSGGKDSSYMLYQLVGMGLRVLSFTLDNGFISEDAKANIRRMTDTLGVTHIFGETPHMNAIFVDSLRRYANVCNGCFKTIYTMAVNLARQKGIKTIVTGLSRGQFFETRLTEEVFADDNFAINDIHQSIENARRAYHQRDDIISRSLDVEVFRADGGFDDIQFIDFYRYCDADLDELYTFLNEQTPWLLPSDTGRSTNCLINDLGIYVHQKRRGFHNYALPYSWDVRMGHKTREQAIHELNDDLDEARIHRMMREIGYDDPLPSGETQKRLVAYYVADGALSSSDLREYMTSHVPDWMVPSYFVPMDHMPLTGNGKVNMAALPAVDDSRILLSSAYVAPESELEIALAKIWEDVLHMENIGIHDNFFDLGGHSLPAIRIVAQIEAAYAIELPLTIFFAHPTIAGLATEVEDIILQDIEQLSDAEIQQLLEEDS